MVTDTISLNNMVDFCLKITKSNLVYFFNLWLQTSFTQTKVIYKLIHYSFNLCKNTVTLITTVIFLTVFQHYTCIDVT